MTGASEPILRTAAIEAFVITSSRSERGICI